MYQKNKTLKHTNRKTEKIIIKNKIDERKENCILTSHEIGLTYDVNELLMRVWLNICKAKRTVSQ